jgi:hypothetical protein
MENLNPYVGVAIACGSAIVGIPAVAFLILHQISDVGMCAIAATAFAPALLGIGITYFMARDKK